MKLISEVNGIQIHAVDNCTGYFLTVTDKETGVENRWAVTKKELDDICIAIIGIP